ncbi:ABC transporter substrate-binding protein [Desulfoluna sp.]|uniref:ABC transporter substrate-binding protein n=1 Tax=Desulfoluna sp. TaxID=2045199 RepID=UPI00262A9CC5|nr:ABC transporter substrate-binding protein [Desulfoluna sp.]
MKKLRLIGILCLVLMFAVTGVGTAFAKKKLFKLKTCWLPEHEAFMAWYMVEKGWDREEGLDMELQYYDSGMAQLEALPSKSWHLGGNGATPHVLAGLRYGTYVAQIGNDESFTNSVLVRANSPILKTKGWNPKNPEVYGSPETIKGITILTTTVSSPHYTMSSWLKVFGLKDKDVIVKHMDQAQAMAAFEAGVGDAVCLWAPNMYIGMDRTWKVVGNINTAGTSLPITMMVAREFGDEHPEIVAKFLRQYFRVTNLMREHGQGNFDTPTSKQLLADYLRFFEEWVGTPLTREMAMMDIKMHPVFTLDEQLELFAKKGGKMSTVEVWMRDITDFFTAQGKFTKAEREKVVNSDYITDKFLKLIKTPIPAYN